MPEYRYQARHSSGQVQAGVLAAETANAAAAILRSQGHHVLQLVPVHTSGRQIARSIRETLNYTSGPSQRDILDFTTQLAVMVRAGINIRSALAIRSCSARCMSTWFERRKCPVRSRRCSTALQRTSTSSLKRERW
jgi:type II secretory pathway component PulF